MNKFNKKCIIRYTKNSLIYFSRYISTFCLIFLMYNCFKYQGVII
nr:MAG TPA: hypothetical protein [Caudoviricetes sp.]DAV67069.1 MAG TPA: hypothetical protein [Caudoviricetes sp.]DAV74924.1 MAG TPA: hypothetical protein [Caudoviricetes sp.]